MLVAVKGHRAAVLKEIAVLCFEIAEGAFGLHKPLLHQGACRVINEHEKSAGRCVIQKVRRIINRQPTIVDLCQNCYAIQLALAHHHLSDVRSPSLHYTRRVTLLLCGGGSRVVATRPAILAS